MSLLQINKKKPSIKYCLQYLPIETLKLINDYRPSKKKYFNKYKNKRKINRDIKKLVPKYIKKKEFLNTLRKLSCISYMTEYYNKFFYINDLFNFIIMADGNGNEENMYIRYKKDKYYIFFTR